MVRGDLSNLKELDLVLVLDQGASLDIGAGLVGDLHDVLGVALEHVVENVYRRENQAQQDDGDGGDGDDEYGE